MTFKELAYSITMNGAQLAAVIAATIYGSIGAGRVVVFLSIVSFFIGLIAMAFAKPAIEAAWAKGKEQNKDFKKYKGITNPFKKSLSRITDLVSVGLLVYFGFWVSATALFASFWFFESFISQVQDFVDEKKGLAA